MSEFARTIRLQLEASGRYGPISALDPHDGSVQEEAERIIAAAIASKPPACDKLRVACQDVIDRYIGGSELSGRLWDAIDNMATALVAARTTMEQNQ